MLTENAHPLVFVLWFFSGVQEFFQGSKVKKKKNLKQKPSSELKMREKKQTLKHPEEQESLAVWW